MRNEVYLWIAVIVVIAIAALLFRYLYQPSIEIGISVHGSVPAHLYPYQKVMLSILATNNGTSAINNMSLGVFVNGNLSTLYKITLPTGKQTTIYYNYSPTAPGAYNISVQADPAKVYDIVDRQQSEGSFAFSTDPASAPQAESVLPGNATYASYKTLSAGGYAISSYIYDNYGTGMFAALPGGPAGRFIEPVLNVTYSYIKNMSIASAQYANGSAYSLWLRGYLSPSIFSVAAKGAELNYTFVETSTGNVTYIDMHNGTSFCSWYGQGWLKVLAVSNEGSCISILNGSVGANASARANNVSASFGSRLVPSNTTPLSTFNGTDMLGTYAASLFMPNNVSFVSESITNQSTSSNICYGVISNYDNVSYCSTYLVPVNGSLGSTALIETTAYRGGYNISAFSLINASLALSQIPVAENMLSGLNITGPSIAYLSGISNTCSLGSAFACYGLTYNNGTISFNMTNLLGQTARINNAGCYKFANEFPKLENVTLAHNASMQMSLRCYNISTPITGVALNLHTNIGINYTVNGTTQDEIGSAFIPFG